MCDLAETSWTKTLFLSPRKIAVFFCLDDNLTHPIWRWGRIGLLSSSPKVKTRSFGHRANSNYGLSLKVNLTDSRPSENILPRVAAGDANAMNACITRYGGMVWSLVRRYVSDPVEAEDLVQEIFTEIWKKASSYESSIALESTFVGLVARRRSIDFLRRQKRLPSLEPISAAEFVPQQLTEKSLVFCDSETIKLSLANLSAETQELFRLFFENGFTHPEIAERTGLPLGTVKTRLRRGLIALREHLQRIGISKEDQKP